VVGIVQTARQWGREVAPVSRPTTDVLLVLDRSGSMAAETRELGSKWDQLVRLARSTVQQLQADVGDDRPANRVSVVVLDDVVQPIGVWKVPAATIDCSSFLEGQEPMGETPLFDAIGTGITRLSTEDDHRPDHVYLVQIFTDGGDNASTHYRGAALNHRMERLQESGRWTFTWMIATANLQKARSALGSLPTKNVIAIPDTAAGFAAGAEQNRASLSQFLLARRAGGSQTETFYLPAPH